MHFFFFNILLYICTWHHYVRYIHTKPLLSLPLFKVLLFCHQLTKQTLLVIFRIIFRNSHVLTSIGWILVCVCLWTLARQNFDVLFLTRWVYVCVNMTMVLGGKVHKRDEKHKFICLKISTVVWVSGGTQCGGSVQSATWCYLLPKVHSLCTEKWEETLKSEISYIPDHLPHLFKLEAPGRQVLKSRVLYSGQTTSTRLVISRHFLVSWWRHYYSQYYQYYVPMYAPLA